MALFQTLELLQFAQKAQVFMRPQTNLSSDPNVTLCLGCKGSGQGIRNCDRSTVRGLRILLMVDIRHGLVCVVLPESLGVRQVRSCRVSTIKSNLSICRIIGTISKIDFGRFRALNISLDFGWSSIGEKVPHLKKFVWSLFW